MRFPLSGRARDFHPLDYAHVGRTERGCAVVLHDGTASLVVKRGCSAKGIITPQSVTETGETVTRTGETVMGTGLVRCHAGMATLLRRRGNVVTPAWQRCYAGVATDEARSRNGKAARHNGLLPCRHGRSPARAGRKWWRGVSSELLPSGYRKARHAVYETACRACGVCE